MRIWLITVGEPLPIRNDKKRILRTGILVNLLVKKGHKVVWWTSTFDHFEKKHLFDNDTTVFINNNFEMKLLHSISYKKNVSISRIINHYGIARKFAKLSESEQAPDIILCSLPTLELSVEATKYGKRRNIPVILDIRDLWPDIFIDLFPTQFRTLSKIALSPMFDSARTACANATAITGINSGFVDWGVHYAGRKRTACDREFPLGYTQTAPAENEIIEAKHYWNTLGLGTNDSEFIVCFLGTIGRHFELNTIIEAAKRLKSTGREFRFIICGSGEQLEYYKNLARECRNVIFPGWVDAAKIWTLMRISNVGLAPYRSSPDFSVSLPNKSIEYLSAGLPIVSSLKGALENLLKSYDCGITYENNNPISLESALIYLYNNPNRLKEMSANGYALFKDRFVAEKVYGDMIKYIENLTDR